MRKFSIVALVIIAIFISATGAAPVAHAADCPDGTIQDLGTGQCVSISGNGTVTNTGTAANNNDASCPTGQTQDLSTGNCVSVSANGTVTDTGAGPTTAAQQIPTTPALGQDADAAYGGVMTKIMGLFAWLVGVAAITLDNAIYYTVVTMGDYVKNITAVGVAWRILRDLGNIALIFGFLAIGINVILGTDAYGWGQKLLPRLLMAAVALNFSLFITEAVVDTGNLFATQFYMQINGGTPAGLQPISFDNIANATNGGVASKIMGQLGLQTLYGNATRNTAIFSGGYTWFIGFMGIILFIVTAFVMFSLAFILIARFVALIFLIIAAPIGIVGFAVPKLEGIGKSWRDQLFSQTITAPILLLMLYIALAIITDARFLTGFGGKSDWTGFITGSTGGITGFASMILSFLVAMGLLLAVTMYAKKLGAAGAALATKYAGKATFGATAWAGRSTGGWLANKTANGLRSTAFGRVPLVGTGLVKGLDRVAGASFDVRGTSALKKFPGGSIDAGAAQKGGYKADLKGRVDSRVKYAKSLKGRELTKEEKSEQTILQSRIKSSNTDVTKKIRDIVKMEDGIAKETAELEKRKDSMSSIEYQINKAGIDSETEKIKTARQDLINAKEALKKEETKLEELESVTDKGAQRKYASVLNLGLKADNPINKYLNSAANTEAAKNILKEAKKSADDKTFDAIKKVVEKEDGGGGEKKEEKEEKKEEPKPEAPK